MRRGRIEHRRARAISLPVVVVGLLIVGAAQPGILGLSMGTADASAPVPIIRLEPWVNEMFGNNFTPGTPVTISLNGTVVGSATTDALGNFDIGFDARDADFEPGDVVTADDGFNIKSLLVSEIGVTAVDVSADTVTGTAVPGSEVDVDLHVNDSFVARRHVFADATGVWTVDFGVPGDEPGEEDTHDLDYQDPPFRGLYVEGGGAASQCDADGDCSFRHWQQRPSIGVCPSCPVIFAAEWPLGVEITLTVDDPATASIDFSEVAFAEQIGSEEPPGWHFHPPIALEPGFLVTMTDGDMTKTLVISDFGFTAVDPTEDTVSGTATPFTEIQVWEDPGFASRIVTADSAGDWVADFSVVGPGLGGPGSGDLFDIDTGASGTAVDADSDGDWTERIWHLLEVFSVTSASEPVPTGTEVTAGVDFSAPALNVSGQWSWGDGATSPGSVNTHRYDDPGVFEVGIELVDTEGFTADGSYQYVVVYDPDGGFVTGGGWIDSPEGAYTTDPTLTGKANFGFVSKYKKGTTVPVGQTEFQFRVADLNFHSTDYEWLVVAGSKARFKGTGTINGVGNYGFMVVATDAALTPSRDVDLFRIEIWNKDNADAIVYDNEIGIAEDADPSTQIGGGSIVIHKDPKASVCRDPLGCVSYVAGAPVRLATALVTSGPAAFLGFDSLNSVELALDDQVDLFGHAIELRNEDTLCSGAGGEAAANAIVADPTVVAVVGTVCSTAAGTAAPILSAAGYSMVSPSNSAPFLTDPATHEAGYLRTLHNDKDNPAAMAEFLRNRGAVTSAVIVARGQFFETSGGIFVEAFESLGGTNLVFVVTDPDGSGVDAALDAVIAAGPPDVLYFPVFEPLTSAIVSGARARASLDDTDLATNDASFSQAFIDGLTPNGEGMFFGVPDFSFMESPEYLLFRDTYFATFDIEPGGLSAYAFDATNMILQAIETVGVVDKDQTLHIGRQALRDALFATSGLAGLTGTITCDQFGDCAATGFVIFTVVDGNFVPAT